MNTMRCVVVGILFLFVAAGAGCTAGPNARGGGVVGALTGAAVGASIGNQNGNGLEGAAIGALTGATAGNVIGGTIDEQEQRYETQQAAYQQQVAAYQQQQARGRVNIAEVINMSRNGLGDEVIVTHIANHGIDRAVSTDDLIYLKNSGVSDRVISNMQAASVAGVVRAGYQEPAAIQPVVIERHHFGHGYYPVPHHGFYHRRPRRHCDGSGWGVSVSHGF